MSSKVSTKKIVVSLLAVANVVFFPTLTLAEGVKEATQTTSSNSFSIESHMYDSEKSVEFPFFLLVLRMQGVNRWHIFNNTKLENLQEHSFETAVIIHLLASIKNEYFNGNVDADHLVMIALFHDMTEIFTGDIPSPMHYDKNVKEGFEKVENTVAEEILKTLPEKLRAKYEPFILQDQLTAENLKLLKAADKLSALMKCQREIQSGNKTFLPAARSIYKALKNSNMPEVDFFMENFLVEEYLQQIA